MFPCVSLPCHNCGEVSRQRFNWLQIVRAQFANVVLGYNLPHLEVFRWASIRTTIDAHTHPVNRALHLIAIPVGFSSIIVIWFHWIIGLLLIPAALGLATLGHIIEGNRPAFLTNPVHVLVAPFWMLKRLFGKH